jgi:hypothetical protein
MFGPLLTSEPPNRPPSGEGRLQLTYAGASADLSRIFFAANDALTAETPFAPEAKDGGPAKDNLYEWSAGQLRLINVLPGNAETEPGASFATATANANANAISKDGSHAFFSDEAGQLYLRIDGAETQKIEDPGKFLSASTDGSKVLLDDGCLYDLAEERCEDLSQGQGGFQGIAGQSDDLSHVYFLDTASLAPGTEARSCQSPPEGSPQRKEEAEGKVPPGYGCNLYAWQEGTTRFVAALLLADNSGTTITRSKSWSASPSSRTAEASPGGRYLAFLSQAQISGYDNAGPCESDHAGGLVQAPCSEAFLYDSATGELRCASCNPSGTRPLGWSVLRLINGGTTSLPQPRYLTDQGRLYFDSRDSLTPFDTNNGAEDVYQYEPEGIGSCKREAGCVSLISAGSEAIDSNFLAIDEDGSNVFFTTRDRLVQRDEDDLIDLYDARVGGGIPSETEVARGECQGEACQAAAVPPDRPTPATSALAGDGNVEEKKASKKHRHGRAHAKKHKGHKRHSKKHGRGGKK